MTSNGQVKKLADMGGVTEDLSVISSKVEAVFCVQRIKDCATSLTVGWQVNQQKAKLIDLEANVTLQERSNGKVDILKTFLPFKGSRFFQYIKQFVIHNCQIFPALRRPKKDE